MKYELFPTLVKEYNVSGYPQKEQLLERNLHAIGDTHNID